MDMQLRASDILEIVEEIEERRLQFYSCLGRSSRSPAVRLICRQFVTRSRNLADTIMQWRTRSSGTPSASASGEAESRHHQAMVSLAFFTGDHSEAYSMSHQATGGQIMSDAIRRSEQAVVFYEGLKEFVREWAAIEVIDNMVCYEKQCLAALTAQTILPDWPSNQERQMTTVECCV